MAECPNCEEDVNVDSKKAGDVIKCSECGVKLEVIDDGDEKELYEIEFDY